MAQLAAIQIVGPSQPPATCHADAITDLFVEGVCPFSKRGSPNERCGQKISERRFNNQRHMANCHSIQIVDAVGMTTKIILQLKIQFVDEF
jgi:hypothetical protein